MGVIYGFLIDTLYFKKEYSTNELIGTALVVGTNMAIAVLKIYKIIT